MKAVVLAAGYATRLRPLTDDVPKMLLPLAERPMLDYLLDRIREVEEIDEIHLVTNSRFAPLFEDWAPSDVTVHDDGTTSNEDRLGALGDIRFAIDRGGLAGDDLLVIAADNLFEFSLRDYTAFVTRCTSSATPASEMRSTIQSTIGLPPTGSKGFAVESVRGRRRVA
jgi:glucose-1-phosphate thymidylyltransferase